MTLEIKKAVSVLQKVAKMDIGPDLLLGAAVGRLMSDGLTLVEIVQRVESTYSGIAVQVQSALEDVIHGE